MNSKFHAALTYHQQGLLDRAEDLYQQILQSDPQNFEVLHLLGVAASQAGNHPRALEYIGRAIARQPGNPNFHFNLGVSLRNSDGSRRLPTVTVERVRSTLIMPTPC